MGVFRIIGKVVERFLYTTTPEPIIILIRTSATPTLPALREPAGIEGTFSSPQLAWEHAQRENLTDVVEAWCSYRDNPRIALSRVVWPPPLPPPEEE